MASPRGRSFVVMRQALSAHERGRLDFRYDRRMGKRRRRSSASWWAESTGGVTHWLLVVMVGVLVIGTGALSAYALNRPAPSSAPLPVRTDFDFGTSRAPTTKVAFLGDSWAGGAGSDEAGSENSYAGKAGRLLGWTYDVFPGGGTGYTTGAAGTGAGPFIDRVQDLIAFAPDVVVVQGSSNDYRASSSDIETAATEVFSTIRAALPAARVYAVGVLDSPSAPADLMQISREAVQAAAGASGVTFIDANAEGWLDIDTDFADGYHPNEQGHLKVAERLAAALDPS